MHLQPKVGSIDHFTREAQAVEEDRAPPKNLALDVSPSISLNSSAEHRSQTFGTMNPLFSPSPLAQLILVCLATRGVKWALLLLAFTSLLVNFSSAHKAVDEFAESKRDSVENHPLYTGGLHEYRKVGIGLISLWREYTAMSDTLSHALRDYNVLVRQEQRAELAEVLAHKYEQAETALAEQKKRRGRVTQTVVYGQLATLKELKKQMKRLDEKIGDIPEYRHPEKNIMLIQGLSVPVNISRALNRSTASLFHRATTSYRAHLQAFNKKYTRLRELLQVVESLAGGSDREKLIKQTTEKTNFFDTQAPISLRIPG
ncbi:hypothetical protein Esti_001932 [Eimeria stiedai]